jgi:hypothetical protein
MRDPATTSSIVPFPTPAQSFGRRPLTSFAGQLTALVLVRHQETDAMVFVSDDDDAVGAVWIPKAMLVIDQKDRGSFLVVTISQNLARQHNLQIRVRSWDRYTPDERLMLTDASQTAARARDRLSGRTKTFSRCNGRDHYA